MKLISRTFLILSFFTCLLSTSIAHANSQYLIVCGYMPEGEFATPIEHTLTSDVGMPTCPDSFIETTSQTVPIIVGGHAVGYSHNRVQTTYVLVYSLPGGY